MLHHDCKGCCHSAGEWIWEMKEGFSLTMIISINNRLLLVEAGKHSCKVTNGKKYRQDRKWGL